MTQEREIGAGWGGGARARMGRDDRDTAVRHGAFITCRAPSCLRRCGSQMRRRTMTTGRRANGRTEGRQEGASTTLWPSAPPLHSIRTTPDPGPASTVDGMGPARRSRARTLRAPRVVFYFETRAGPRLRRFQIGLGASGVPPSLPPPDPAPRRNPAPCVLPRRRAASRRDTFPVMHLHLRLRRRLHRHLRLRLHRRRRQRRQRRRRHMSGCGAAACPPGGRCAGRPTGADGRARPAPRRLPSLSFASGRRRACVYVCVCECVAARP